MAAKAYQTESLQNWSRLDGKLISVSGDKADTIGRLNPFCYRGYVYDEESGLYYLNSRYYDPETGRFVNADGYVSTGQGVLGNNMFAYCGNNPVNRVDPSGARWEGIGNLIKGICDRIKTGINSIFGAGATTTHQIEKEIVPSIFNLIVTVKIGARESQTITTRGNSSKPISVYINARSDDFLYSSIGMKLNIRNLTINYSFGLDNRGTKVSFVRDNETWSFSSVLDVSQFKIGVEGARTIKWDRNTDLTNYVNASCTGWGITAIYMLVTTGQWNMGQQPVYAN